MSCVKVVDAQNKIKEYFGENVFLSSRILEHLRRAILPIIRTVLIKYNVGQLSEIVCDYITAEDSKRDVNITCLMDVWIFIVEKLNFERSIRTPKKQNNVKVMKEDFRLCSVLANLVVFRHTHKDNMKKAWWSWGHINMFLSCYVIHDYRGRLAYNELC